MRIDFTTAFNFRNLSQNNSPVLTAKWEPGINLILGRNGIGKTNLLEALSILTGWGAFGRTSSVISWSGVAPRAKVSAHVTGEEDFDLTAEISSRVTLRKDDKAVTFTELRLSLPSIIFLTGSLNLIDGSPSSRRLFIDRLCSLFYAPFAKRLADFKYVARSRTALLRQGKSPDVTTELFCQLGGWILDARRRVVSDLMSMLPEDSCRLEFVPAIHASGQDFLREALARNSRREFFAQHPLDGPNYDELNIMIHGRPASESLSRGQKRRLILRLIITAGRLISIRLKREPVLLFDDLTAELDSEGRSFVHSELAATRWQVFITAPEKPFRSTKKFGGITLE